MCEVGSVNFKIYVNQWTHVWWLSFFNYSSNPIEHIEMLEIASATFGIQGQAHLTFVCNDFHIEKYNVLKSISHMYRTIQYALSVIYHSWIKKVTKHKIFSL